MPRDFRSFARENQTSQSAEKILNENQEKVNDYQDILNKYKNMNQNDLMNNLFSEASKLKKEGKLDANTLSNLKSTLSPFLNSEQQEMLNSLVNAINEQK
ncbi:MAG: hypothetical protein IJW36_00570 [Clostridia bacterium]|nr:hypothetical protein [Clostridia bacterium]